MADTQIYLRLTYFDYNIYHTCSLWNVCIIHCRIL